MKDQLIKQFADLPEEFRSKIKIPEVVYNAKPTPTCSTGTRGRMAAAEAIEVDQEIRNLIIKNPDENEIYKLARSKGLITIKEDAMLKAMAGEIPFEEVGKM